MLNIPSLQIGITDLCNLRCIHCGQNAYEGYGHPDKLGPPPFRYGKKGFMSINLLNKILNDIKKESFFFNIFNFFWFGETLLHPEWLNMIEMCYKLNYENKFFNHFWLYTNGLLLNKFYSENLINISKKYRANFSRLYFSLDAYDKSSFLKIKRFDAFESVIKNLDDFLRLKKEYNINTQVVIGFIVLFENIDGLSIFIEKIKDLFFKYDLDIKIVSDSPDPILDCIYVRVAYLPEQKKFERLYQKALFSIKLKKHLPNNDIKIDRFTNMSMIDINTLKPKARNPCTAPFRNITINWDGRLAACCSDYEMEIKLPDLNNVSIKEAWFSKAYKDLRLAHLSGDLSNYSRCLHCGNLDDIPLNDNEIEGLI